VQEVATTQESLGLNCCLRVLAPDGLRLEHLEVADECQGQQVKFSCGYMYFVTVIPFQTGIVKLYLLSAHCSFT
jgi:hypothetical protein